MNTNETVGSTLRHLREAAGLSAKDVASLLATRYSIKISPYTLFSYERDLCTPDPYKFLALCIIYKCNDVLHEFGLTKEPSSFRHLKKEDREILKRFHNLSDSEKDLIRGALGIEKPELKKEKLA